ncbi:DUF2058 domain-containing protein [Dyella jiangningensis]|uniref:Nucleoprotein/polynucleotide-associated enzyme n=1 Tax=Dyella jiangningensis TaxID=1379159 RepID=A0A328P1H2_9GAMM|nr:DUF2058 domain-containing protein [Dyella jiangningensis]RAO76030.1 nucleoprotein/polynucleotide-associated enzyme [Dyella jiangningensis]
MRNPLQEQLLKAGLAKKGKVDQIAREQAKQRQGKAQVAAPEEKIDAQRLQAERAERDRALAAERNAQSRARELAAQVRQIVDASKVKREGEISYRFTDGRSVLVNESLRTQLAKGSLVVVRSGDGYELLPRLAAEKVRERDASAIVLDHGQPSDTTTQSEDDAYYSQFKVPDDLTW